MDMQMQTNKHRNAYLHGCHATNWQHNHKTRLSLILVPKIMVSTSIYTMKHASFVFKSVRPYRRHHSSHQTLYVSNIVTQMGAETTYFALLMDVWGMFLFIYKFVQLQSALLVVARREVHRLVCAGVSLYWVTWEVALELNVVSCSIPPFVSLGSHTLPH